MIRNERETIKITVDVENGRAKAMQLTGQHGRQARKPAAARAGDRRHLYNLNHEVPLEMQVIVYLLLKIVNSWKSHNRNQGHKERTDVRYRARYKQWNELQLLLLYLVRMEPLAYLLWESYRENAFERLDELGPGWRNAMEWATQQVVGIPGDPGEAEEIPASIPAWIDERYAVPEAPPQDVDNKKAEDPNAMLELEYGKCSSLPDWITGGNYIPRLPDNVVDYDIDAEMADEFLATPPAVDASAPPELAAPVEMPSEPLEDRILQLLAGREYDMNPDDIVNAVCEKRDAVMLALYDLRESQRVYAKPPRVREPHYRYRALAA